LGEQDRGVSGGVTPGKILKSQMRVGEF
jgi:hypothetical protein